MTDDDNNENQENEKYGVLLYYKYVVVEDLNSLFSFYHSDCSSLSLLGRVRLSSHGVNATVGGKLWALEKHIEALKANSLFDGTDFKLASSDFPFNDKVARECGFTSLSIRIVKELVTFSANPHLKLPDISNAGRHLSAVEFHSVLCNAGTESLADGKELVLLDARNLYETRIGKFSTPPVVTMDPGIRQYSDLHSWIDDNSEHLRGKNVLMYCTGGIRCEMASAYIRSKGAGFENIFQLFGGIQRYLEQFPNGGFFKGKNFVFDHRISVGSSDSNILGHCLLCGLSFDDYSARCRCSYCRMLVLVCDSCRVKKSDYVCELCQKHGKLGSNLSCHNDQLRVSMPMIKHNSAASAILLPQPLSGKGGSPSRKLKILCLHGFRQNASSFKGRTASLAKKIKDIAELIYIDAPHKLPFIYQPRMAEPASEDLLPIPAGQAVAPPENCKTKFAWLTGSDSKGTSQTDWKIADGPFDPLQYQQQNEGYDVSLSYLKAAFLQHGPFDGILGFSQGAAMAASVCALKETLKDNIDLRFVILCSGFPFQHEKFERGSIKLPSLHIFGSSSGNDRQIGNEASRQLVSRFEEGSVVIEHDCGHIIPTRHPYIDEIRDFLGRFI